MAQQSPRLARHVTVRTTLVESPRNGGIMRSLSADAALQHGLDPYANIIDEFHAHRTADLYAALTTGTCAREQPFTLWISTAGVNSPGVLSELHASMFDGPGELEDLARSWSTPTGPTASSSGGTAHHGTRTSGTSRAGC